MFASFNARKDATWLVQYIYAFGIFPDWNADWFTAVGTIIVENMLILCVMPPLEFLGEYLFRHARRMYDQKKCWPNNLADTTSDTLLRFESIYNGPEFKVYFQYAFIMNVVLVTFLFGPLIPILFPIAWVCLFV